MVELNHFGIFFLSLSWWKLLLLSTVKEEMGKQKLSATIWNIVKYSKDFKTSSVEFNYKKVDISIILLAW